MKRLDRVLQQMRLRAATPYILDNAHILDVGCFDDTTLRTLPHAASYTGVDPHIEEQVYSNRARFYRGYFPDAIPPDAQRYDVVLMLAVLEHIPLVKWNTVAIHTDRLLARGGRVIMTLPAPTVDHILTLLKSIRILDGMDLDNHQGVDPGKDIPRIFGLHFAMQVHRRFQLGLNHLFVFEKR